MGETSIQWTHYTFNPVEGCEKVSPGCKNCYAEAKNKWLKAGRNWGPNTRREPRSDDYWKQPLVWDKKARLQKQRHRVFCASVSDVFEDHPDWVEPRRRLFELIRRTPNLDWLLLTKRPENIARMLPVYDGTPDPMWPNVWLGTTVEDGQRARERVFRLFAVRAAVRFLSCEPLLEGVAPELAGIDWVIIGGESGRGARRFDVAWARSLISRCRRAGVAPFVKQLGANVIDRNDAGFEAENHVWADDRVPELRGLPVDEGAWPTPHGDVEHDIDGHRDEYQGAPVRVRLKHRAGGDPSEWPLDLRVREFPKVQAQRTPTPPPPQTGRRRNVVAMKAGIQSAVKKTTPVAGMRGSVIVELECGHVLVRAASSVGTHAWCPECTKAAAVAKRAAKAPAPPKSHGEVDVRDAYIAELKKQNEYLRALANLAPPKGVPLAVVKPPPPAVAAELKPLPPKPPDDVKECGKCKHVGLISEDFGWLLIKGGGKWLPQKLCKKCNKANMDAGLAKLRAARSAVA